MLGGSGRDAASTFPILDSEERDAPTTTEYFPNRGNASGVRIFLSITDNATLDDIQMAVEIRDHYGNYYQYDSHASSAEAESVAFELTPANGFHIGKGFRLVVTHENDATITYAISGEWLP